MPRENTSNRHELPEEEGAPGQESPAKEHFAAKKPRTVEAMGESANLQRTAKELRRAQEELEKQNLLRDVEERGRAVTSATITWNYAKERGLSEANDTMLFDKKGGKEGALAQVGAVELPTLLKLEGRVIDATALALQEADIGAVITILPVVEVIPAYKGNVKETKGFLGLWSKKVVTGKIRDRKNDGERPMVMGEFADTKEGQEPAFRIFVYVGGTKDQPYKDLQTRDSTFRSSIILPESLAREAFEKIQSDPAFVWQMLKKLDPSLMEYEENLYKELGDKHNLQNQERYLVVPEKDLQKVFSMENGKLQINPSGHIVEKK